MSIKKKKHKKAWKITQGQSACMKTILIAKGLLNRKSWLKNLQLSTSTDSWLIWKYKMNTLLSSSAEEDRSK